MPQSASLPKRALRLTDSRSAVTFAKAKDGEDERKAQILGYSGQAIEGHWYWGKLIIDLAGMSAGKSKYPVLRDHRTDKELGLSKKPTKDNDQLMFGDVTILDNEEGDKFISNSKQGFPYQASIYALPTKIERIAEDTFCEVNGVKFEGPGYVWRKSELQEVSVCVFGWDRKTESVAFSDEGNDLVELDVEMIGGQLGEHSNEEEEMPKEKSMFKSFESEDDFNKFVKGIADAAVEEAGKKFAEERTGLEDQIKTLTEDNTQLGETNEKNEDRLLALEKKMQLSHEADLDREADGIWEMLLSDSSVPEHLRSKCKLHVRRSKFMNEDGTFDKEKFAEACKVEMKDWEVEDDHVQGAGSFSRDVMDAELPGDEEADKMAEDVSSRMAGYVGGGTAETK